MPVDVRSAALTIVAALAIVTVLRAAAAMIIPIVLGILISYALDPAVAWLERRHVPRSVSAAILLLALDADTCWLIYGLRFEGQAIVNKLPEAARRIRRTFEDAPPTTAAAIQQVQKAATELEKAASAAATPPRAPSGVTRVQVEAAPINITDYLLWGSIGAAAAIGQVLLVLFLVYFLLVSGDLYKRKLVKIVGPSLTKKKLTVQILADIDHQIEMFLFVEVLTSSIVAVCM